MADPEQLRLEAERARRRKETAAQEEKKLREAAEAARRRREAERAPAPRPTGPLGL